MNWKTEAIEKLKLYEPRKLALKAIPDEIKRLELAAQGIRSATSDGTPVQGGGSGREDMLLSNIVQREELKLSLKMTETWVAMVDAALKVLSREDQLLLDRFYIHPVKGAADLLADDLRRDPKTIYRRKDAALRRFTVALYGVTES